MSNQMKPDEGRKPWAATIWYCLGIAFCLLSMASWAFHRDGSINLLLGITSIILAKQYA